jgi:hypothetical protein
MEAMNQLPREIEIHRDRTWHRESELRIENAYAVERFIYVLGFCSSLTDSRRAGPSHYIAVCGRRDVYSPRNIQKDPESKLAWTIKDELLIRGGVYYGKLRGNRAIFIARRLLPHFNTVWGISRKQEHKVLSGTALSILRTLRKEWEMSTKDLRLASGIGDRATFSRGLDELQRVFKVISSDVTHQPTFTYIWSLAEARFAEELVSKVAREVALKEIARAYLSGAGMTRRGELASVTGLSKPDAGLGNWALVDAEFALRLAPGVYRLKARETSSTPIWRSVGAGL